MTEIEVTEKHIEKMKQLFINFRRYFIVQNNDKEAVEKYFRKNFYFHDDNISRHLKGKSTYGIFSGKYLSKFITFDVDTRENSERDTKHLVDVLEREFNFNRSDIHVSFSGKKGYHIDIYFNEMISNKILKRFYLDVLERAEFNEREVELRPLNNIGMKLPLGVHRETNKRCWYVDNQTFKMIETIDYILDVEPIDPLVLKMEYAESEPIILNQDNSKEISTLIDKTVFNTFDVEEHLEHIEYVLENNCLKYPKTRNDMTLALAIYLKDALEFEEIDTSQTIFNIMMNTKKIKPNLISSSEKEIKEETGRITNVAYKFDYRLYRRNKDVEISRDDIEEILKIKKWNLKQLYFIHLIHAKRYANEKNKYYMTYKTMSKMGATTQRGRLKSQIDTLNEQYGLIEIIESNVIDIERSKETGQIMKKPNVYKINVDIKKAFENDVDSITIKDNENIKLEEILKRFEQRFRIRLKDSLSREQYLKICRAS